MRSVQTDLTASFLMAKITLQFPNMQLLWQFKIAIDSANCCINASMRTLVCHCTHTNIDIAIRQYQAIVITREQCT